MNRSNGRGIYLFVNRRPVRDRLLTHAVLEGFRNLIPANRYPVAVLFVEVPPSEVDVNVHPSKWEVKFSDSETVHRSVIRAIRAMLEATPWLKTPVPRNPEGVKEPQGLYGVLDREASFPVSWPGSFRAEPRPESEDESREGSSPVSFLGQIQGTYLIFSSSEGILLLDQHAAHERILLEKLGNDLSGGNLSRQGLLLPEVVDLPSAEVEIIREHLGDLGRMGFELEPAGGRTFWLKSIPQILSTEDPLQVLREMIREISSWQKGADLGQFFDSLLKMMACRGAIKAGRAMGRQEAQALLYDLQKCRFPSHCPHGRPTLLRITHSDLEKMFARK